MRILHMTEATDMFGDRRELDEQRVIGRLQFRKAVTERGFICIDQAAFGLALCCVTEDVECRAPEPTQACEDTEGRHQPGAEIALAQMTGDGIASRQQWRGQMEPDFELAVELRLSTSRESRIGIKA